MVLSKIDSSISYPERKRERTQKMLKWKQTKYVIYVKGVEIVVAIGNSRDDFKKKDIVYFPIYLVKSNGKVVQIGLYEVPQSKLASYIDTDGDLDLEKLDPLIYTFATKAFLEKRRLPPPNEEEDEGESETKNDPSEEDSDDEEKVQLTNKDYSPKADTIPNPGRIFCAYQRRRNSSSY